ncbi:MAG: 50S ribosomal protein L24 [Candidatus Harrisonbacteria bacterium CG10_big_fil_rev_8_21_14_0_10_40_38]|uniref:Large ribosomal subunit protein uL24 n=1 Tax=Candidatus Harrisonbacteria bacterium CG10_big_fil_rev_8_21_14_0_10_40_38 TaxID=1974583 RepID=A0A2H0USF3_9BACT|nr:MAG: 50S ribosomal protein L24 [Candidatus Harrisonbacteria bacterium CG10_big_fil_rev_8_21_14_0_10_40_38]
MFRIHKGDTVYIRSGKDRGKTGKVLHIYTKTDRIQVEGINAYKKNARPKREGEKGEIVTLFRSLPSSKVMPYCSKCGKGARISTRVDKNKKEKYCSKCGVTI